MVKSPISTEAATADVIHTNLAAPYYWAGHRLVGERLEFSKHVTSEIPFPVMGTLFIAIVVVIAVSFLWRKGQ